MFPHKNNKHITQHLTVVTNLHIAFMIIQERRICRMERELELKIIEKSKKVESHIGNLVMDPRL